MATFVRVAELGSFSRAARELGLAQSSVSRSVAAFEKRLGCQLLDRSSRNVTLTGMGSSCFERCRTALSAIADVEAVAKVERREGRVRIRAPLTFGRDVLTPLVMTYLSRHPGSLAEFDLEDRSEDPVREGIDLAVTLAPVRLTSLVPRRLATVDRYVVATPRFARRSPLRTPRALAETPCAVYRGAGLVWVFRRAGRVEQVTVRPNLVSNSIDVVKSAVLADVGVGLLPSWTVVDEIREGTLRRLYRNYRLDPLEITALWGGPRRSSPLTRDLLSFLAANLPERLTV